MRKKRLAVFKYPSEIEKERTNSLNHSLLGNSVHELRIQSTDEKRQARLASAASLFLCALFSSHSVSRPHANRKQVFHCVSEKTQDSRLKTHGSGLTIQDSILCKNSKEHQANSGQPTVKRHPHSSWCFNPSKEHFTCAFKLLLLLLLILETYTSNFSFMSKK